MTRGRQRHAVGDAGLRPGSAQRKRSRRSARAISQTLRGFDPSVRHVGQLRGDRHARHDFGPSAFVLVLLAAARRLAVGARRPAAARRRRSSPRRSSLDGLPADGVALADLRRQLHQPAPQPADADHAGQRAAASSRSGRSRPARSATSRRRRSLRDNVLYVTGPQNVAWALDARTRPPDLALSPRAAASGLTACCGLVNRGFGVARRQAVHDDARRAPARARHEDRRGRRGTRRWRTTRSATPRRSRRSSSRTRSSSASPAASTASAASSTPTTRRRGKRAWRFYTDPRARRAGQRHVGRRLVEDAAAPASG